jgi:methylenetetrahydrofolate dehydrogenase (NADP+)/methenyltetrahydrofolate cyclohydrolase
VIDVYVRLKKIYGEDILVGVDIYNVADDDLFEQIKKLNNDENIYGIIVQLPLSNPDQTDEAVSLIAPEKDVDGLGADSIYTPATAMAINWLMAGYNIILQDKKIAIVGNGRLVGAPLYKIWKKAGFDVAVYDDKTIDLGVSIKTADVIVSATGVPGLIKSDMVKNGAVIVDAGTASENGKIVGDLAEEVRTRKDLTVTPIKGGVGPLTVAALFDNVIQAARKVADIKGQQDL